MKKHNFSAGPAILPRSVIEKSAEAILDFNGNGLSILEVSHRGPGFTKVLKESIALVKELLKIGDEYAVLFLTGGASSQFFMTALNILDDNDTGLYINTGTWSTKAIKEAKLYGNVEVIASSKDKNFSYIPKDYSIPSNAKYLHITSNNTIFGTQFHNLPDTDVRIICDMSSDFLSRPIEVERFGLIYAGAQKNLGPAGVTVVIVRDDMLGTVKRHIPTLLDYRTFIKKGSMFNTPPAYPIYVSMLTLKWIKAKGGLAKMERLNKSKAKLLYNEIDSNPLFSSNIPNKRDRSLMNVTFQITNPKLKDDFLAEAATNGIVGIKGHRSIGGFRASIYNAMPRSSVKVLTDLMADFTARKG